MKRTYFLVAIASLQIILGSITLVGAAQPIRLSQDVLVQSGSYYHFAFGILGSGRVSGNLSELQGRSVTLFIFDDQGIAAFAAGSNTPPSLFEQSGTRIVFDVQLPGSGQYHVVAVNLPSRQALQIQLGLVVFGLKTVDAIIALIGASLMLSVWAWRRGRQAPSSPPPPAPFDPTQEPPSDPAPDPVADPPSAPEDPAPDPADDNTRIY